MYPQKYCFLVSSVIVLFKFANSLTLIGKECPHGEVHRSCAFYDEYTCWVQSDRTERVKSPPKRLPHCRAGCYCRRSLVREFPGGPCIVAAGCRNRKLQAMLKNLPALPHQHRQHNNKDILCTSCKQ